MRKTHDPQVRKKYLELFQQAQPPKWVQDMLAHYWRTGSFRARDLRRLLGDPTKGVEVGPNMSVAALLSAAARLRK
jgi:hypothetical protein